MYSAKISVSEKETMENSLSQKLPIILIVVSSIAFVFVVIFLACGGFGTFNDTGIQQVNVGVPVVLDNDDSEENFPIRISLELSDVPVHYDCELLNQDTEKGTIEVTDMYFPDKLPLCLTTCTMAGWFIEFTVVGGYHPEDVGNHYVDIYQGKTGNREYVGTISMVFDEGTIVDLPCCCDAVVYRATFVSCGCIQLDSNYKPDMICECDPWGPGTDFNCWEDPTINGDEPLDKLVDFYFFSDWTGCGDSDQDFGVILAHKSCIQGVPPSERIYIAS